MSLYHRRCCEPIFFNFCFLVVLYPDLRRGCRYVAYIVTLNTSGYLDTSHSSSILSAEMRCLRAVRHDHDKHSIVPGTSFRKLFSNAVGTSFVTQITSVGLSE